MADKGRTREFARWPAYEKLYLHAFEKMLEEREKRGKLDGNRRMGTTAEDVMHWWLDDGVLPGQLSMDEYSELMEEETKS